MEPPTNPTKRTARHFTVRRAIFLLVGAALVLAGWIIYIKTVRDEAAANPVASETSLPDDRDTQYRRLVVGTWEDDYEGKRTMTLNDDGSGTMVVELSGLKAALSAPRLRFDMTWAVAGGRLQKQTLGGAPASTVQFILKTMGDRVDEPILELSQDRLLLLDKDGKTTYDWRRKAASPK